NEKCAARLHGFPAAFPSERGPAIDALHQWKILLARAARVRRSRCHNGCARLSILAGNRRRGEFHDGAQRVALANSLPNELYDRSANRDLGSRPLLPSALEK